ncbi:MAG: hypothetical protein PHG00_08485 [Methylococcales bacterium]|nr:hypothetical protein [Methylococcales bacterium]
MRSTRPAPVVLWAVTREARILVKIKQALSDGQNRESVFTGINKQPVSNALNRLSMNDLDSILVLSAKADRQIKGQQQSDAWETLLAIA